MTEALLPPPTLQTESRGTHASSHAETVLSTPPAPRLRWWQIGLLLVALGSTLGGLFYAGWMPRVHQNTLLAHESEEIRTALPRVLVMTPKLAPHDSIAMLPGDVQAVEETSIYARTNGYLKRWHVDIGDEVTEGQLLAEIDAPEVDQQLRQVAATLEQLKARKRTAETTYQLAKATLERIEALPVGIVTMQELDERRATVETAESAISVAEADIAAGAADLQRVTELHSYLRVQAPFAGTITARNIDVGQLVTVGNGSAYALFQLARTNPVRVFINVPQIYAPGIKAGLPAELVVREIPGRTFQGTVTRTARAIDATTRTLLTEVRVPNDDHALLTGSYVQVKMNVHRDNPPLLVPASSLIFNADGVKLAVVGEGDVVHLRDVDVESDHGAQLGIATGLLPTDRVVTNPGDRLSEGLQVAVEVAAETTPAAGK